VINGTDVAHMSDREATSFRLRNIGFVFQRFYLMPTLSARENVELPMAEAGVSKTHRLSRAKELLTYVGLGHRERHRPSELSGGEQQRVAIARALINAPELILADEPTGNLDSHTGDEIVELLLALRAERQTTLVIATHDPDVARRAPRVFELVDGCLA